MNKEKNIFVTIDSDNVRKAQECLRDNGIEESETGVVIEAIGAILLDIDLEDFIDWEFKSEN